MCVATAINKPREAQKAPLPGRAINIFLETYQLVNPTNPLVKKCIATLIIVCESHKGEASINTVISPLTKSMLETQLQDLHQKLRSMNISSAFHFATGPGSFKARDLTNVISFFKGVAYNLYLYFEVF